MILALFIDILWSVSGAIVLPGTGLRWTGYMVPLAFAYAGVGGVFGWMVGRPLVRETNALQTAEATFRFGLSRTREHAEDITFAHGEPMERLASTARFAGIVQQPAELAPLPGAENGGKTFGPPSDFFQMLFKRLPITLVRIVR